MKLIRFLSLITALAVVVPAGFAQMETSHKSTVKVASLPQARPSGNPDKVVARVNGVPITQDVFDLEMKRVFPYYSLHGNAAPKGYETEIHDKALNLLIDAELTYQEAKRRKLAITPAEWQKRVAELRKDYKTPAEFEAATSRIFGSRKAFDAALRHDMLLDKIYLLEVKQKSVVTEADARKEYTQYKRNYAVPEMVQFQTISVLFPKNATAADKADRLKKIQDLAGKAKAAKNSDEFGLLAEKSSEDEYRVMMGMHKPAHKGSMDPAFEGFILGMKEGQVAGPVESSIGYHIIRLNKHQMPHQMTYAEAHADILKSMRQEKLKARNKSFHEALRKTAKIEILS
jgi:parvulin-like peptidyl-prolyl isomerase